MGILYVLASVLAIAYILYFLYYVLSGEDAQSSIPLELRPILSLGRPIFGILIDVNKDLGIFDPDSERGLALRRQLDGAGIEPEDLSAGEFAALTELCAFAPMLFLAATLGSFLTPFLLLLIMLLGGLIGLFYPYFKLIQRMEQRNAQIFAELPYVVDLLSLAIEAGLDFRRAVERLVEFSDDTPLIRELRGFLHDLDMGLSTEKALKAMSERVHVLAFFSFVEAIIQATQMGVDITPTLHAQAEQMRTQYFQTLEKEANKTPVLILLPTILCIFPPLFILILTPAMVRMGPALERMGSVTIGKKPRAVSASKKPGKSKPKRASEASPAASKEPVQAEIEDESELSPE